LATVGAQIAVSAVLTHAGRVGMASCGCCAQSVWLVARDAVKLVICRTGTFMLFDEPKR